QPFSHGVPVSSQMAVLWQILRASPLCLFKAFSYSLKSTRCTQARLKQLLSRYKEEQLDDKQFEDRHMQLQTLPSLSKDFLHWLQMNVCVVLSAASQDRHTFWSHLDMKRREMEEAEVGQRASIQIDLWDLMRKVSLQVK
uniref:Uncharacterized protein n=1 Tax=Esox lucius TaxID=8010 RepID=A0A6Q2WRA4_ESOLU